LAANDGASSFTGDTALNTELSQIGFRDVDIKAALEALSSQSSFASALLSALPPFEAALEYLLLFTPEAELPERFASSRVSEPFLSSLHAGKEDIHRRWIEDKAVKEAGYPRAATKSAMKSVDNEPETVFEMLAYKLTGLEVPQTSIQEFDQESREVGRQSEIEAVQAVFPSATYDSETSTLSIPCSTAPVTFHIIYTKLHPYPESSRLPPFYISSNSVPAYIRLHLTSLVFTAVSPNGERYENEGICFNAVEALEAGWEALEANGPPKLEDVLRNLLPSPSKDAPPEEVQLPTGKAKSSARSKPIDPRTDKRILEDFQALKNSKAYKEMEEARKRLPAWESREEIKQMIDENQVIIVVGETGKCKLESRSR
jgi:ATP-dependent RNA helicase DHX57